MHVYLTALTVTPNAPDEDPPTSPPVSLIRRAACGRPAKRHILVEKASSLLADASKDPPPRWLYQWHYCLEGCLLLRRHHRQNPGSSSREGTGSPCPAPPGAPNQGATCHAVAFRRKRIPTPTSATMPLKKPWHGLLRALVQEWADMNCTINSASNFSGLQAGMSPISLVQLAGSVRKFNLNRPFILPILQSTLNPANWQLANVLARLVGAGDSLAGYHRN